MDWGFRAWQAKPIVAQGKQVLDRRGADGRREQRRPRLRRAT